MLARWHLFFTAQQITDVWTRTLNETHPSKLRRLPRETLLEIIERHLIIPSNLKGGDRYEFIEKQADLFTKGFKERELENIRLETGMKKYKSVD